MTPLHISNEKLERILRALAPAIEKYRAIQARVYACDVLRDREFQRLFNGFYRVRKKNGSAPFSV